MARHRSLWLACLGLILLWSLSACSPKVARSDQEDEKNPYFQKAKKFYQEREYKKAVEHYRKALEMDPNNAAAHFELGLLYEDKLQDYAYAIYHYRRYLELRPHAEKAEYVKQFVVRSQIDLAASIPNSPLASAEEISRLRGENSNLLRQAEWLLATNQVLELRLAKLQTTPEETRQPVIVQTNVFLVAPVTNPATSAGVRPPSANQAQAHASASAPPQLPPSADASARSRTYVVQRGDTLYAIALKVYGRRDKWQAIYQANRTVIGPPPKYTLRVGQKLAIPSV